MLGLDNFKELMGAVDSIKDAIKAPFQFILNWIADKFGIFSKVAGWLGYNSKEFDDYKKKIQDVQQKDKSDSKKPQPTASSTATDVKPPSQSAPTAVSSQETTAKSTTTPERVSGQDQGTPADNSTSPTKDDGERPQDFKGLIKVAEAHDFTVTSTTGGDHNKNSLHYRGKAIDVSVKGKSSSDVDKFIKVAEGKGIKVRDERTRPPGQAIWTGPHLHMEIPGQSPVQFAKKNVGGTVASRASSPQQQNTPEKPFTTALYNSSNAVQKATLHDVSYGASGASSVIGQNGVGGSKPNDQLAVVDPAKMAQYVARMEGFYKKDEKGNYEQTVARRNNNPGNLRASQKDQKVDDKGYRTFDSEDEGWQALQEQIKSSAGKGGGLNMREFFGGKKGVYPGYAPAADKNDPFNYSDYVAKSLGVDPTKTLSLQTQPVMEPPSPVQGLKIAMASKESDVMTKNAMAKNNSPSIYAPQKSQTINNKNTTIVDLKAKNNEDTYQRTQNSQYVPS
jgi:hypothetical protein